MDREWVCTHRFQVTMANGRLEVMQVFQAFQSIQGLSKASEDCQLMEM